MFRQQIWNSRNLSSFLPHNRYASVVYAVVECLCHKLALYQNG